MCSSAASDDNLSSDDTYWDLGSLRSLGLRRCQLLVTACSLFLFRNLDDTINEFNNSAINYKLQTVALFSKEQCTLQKHSRRRKRNWLLLPADDDFLKVVNQSLDDYYYVAFYRSPGTLKLQLLGPPTNSAFFMHWQLTKQTQYFRQKLQQISLRRFTSPCCCCCC